LPSQPQDNNRLYLIEFGRTINLNLAYPPAQTARSAYVVRAENETSARAVLQHALKRFIYARDIQANLARAIDLAKVTEILPDGPIGVVA
jgi:hypothetical protein